jgi:hypothetical protein
VNARFLVAAALGAFVAGATPALADVSLTIADGRVTIVARNATPRQILEAWSRQGHTRIVNVERVSGGPTTLIITNEQESKALAIVLRSVAGYIAAPRSVAIANASQYDRILIMPTSYAAPAPAYRASAPMPPMMPQPVIVDVPPDPMSLANDDGAAPPAPVFGGDPNGIQSPTPPVNAPTQGAVLPYNPPPDQNGDQQQTTPPVLPSAGQQTAGAPGVLPLPQPAQPQSPQQPR